MISKYQKIVEDAFKKEDRVCSYEVDGNKVYVKKREKQTFITRKNAKNKFPRTT